MKKLLFIYTSVIFLFLLQYQSHAQNNNQQSQKPSVIIEGIEAGLVEMSSLLNVDSIRCSDKSYKIESFSMSLLFEQGKSIMELRNNKNGAITDEMRTSLKRNGFSKKVWIENIMATNNKGETIQLSSVTLQLK